ncbi:MAG TPA: lysylphosphatidylglycerol synthase domain-containing protein [Candidatus Saccharimonadales bacterium]|nr:lysylphosphatidylglycerol synthase domain-containing protein [Candidatus Saccharimonadales bacterium]
MSKRIRYIIGGSIVVATIVGLAFYLIHHKSTITALAHISPVTVVWVFLLYLLWFGSLVLILQASLWTIKAGLPVVDNVLLNAYSLFVNYFLPGQGGPALRGAYLKRVRNIPLRNYLFSAALYYICYAVVSAYLILTGTRIWWQALLGLILMIVAGFVLMRTLQQRVHIQGQDSRFSSLGLMYLLSATILQAAVQMAIYGVELHSAVHQLDLRQVITYTGTADFALFVALTPGAIGIREAFLLLSGRLHHIASGGIIAANVIDRGVYLLFLGLVFIVVVGFHAKRRLQFSASRRARRIPD